MVEFMDKVKKCLRLKEQATLRSSALASVGFFFSSNPNDFFSQDYLSK